ncbi:MAG: protoporphyrinogen oxidase [Magnetococcales bacterium]|nr:protoporphyrinogen oxidase [Magnetococcales bacterium]
MNEKVIIVGGGISGLSTALFLSQGGMSVRVLESRQEPGGNLLTSNSNGYQIEHGPNSTLHKPGREEDGLGRLMERIGLTPIVANEQAGKRFIVRKQKLIPLPASPVEFLTTPAFSVAAKMRLLLEPFIGRAKQEESIAQFVERRLGREFLDYAIDPFVSGVYAGNVHQLSVQAAVAKIYALEADHGSLIRGALFGRQKNMSGMPKGRLISFPSGMAALPKAIEQALPEGTIQLGKRVVGLQRSKDLWQVYWEGKGGTAGIEQADRVILSTPAPQTAQIIQGLFPAAARLLSTIYYPPILSIALAYSRQRVEHALDGFGFLIPRCEEIRTLGSLFSSTLFPGRAPEGQILLTNFIGGATDLGVEVTDDRSLAVEVSHEISQLLGIEGKPDFVQVTRYRESIPQYTLGHLTKLKNIDRALTGQPGLYLRSNWSGGISVGDCIHNGELLAEEILKSNTPKNS